MRLYAHGGRGLAVWAGVTRSFRCWMELTGLLSAADARQPVDVLNRIGLKTSLIRQRIADFLKFHQPFEFFSETDRLALASSGRGQLRRHSLSF
jgi:hypothetical protein